MIDERILKSEEQVDLRLRDIYRKHGYSCFKMSKFEEYDLYSQNKDFLVSDSVITFNDTNGKLMALKPDVTLSIVKNHNDSITGVQRLYYNENVYRVSERTHSYKEIMQSGLECMGDINSYNIFEVINLAILSLRSISDRYVLNITHLGIMDALISKADFGNDTSELLKCINSKNAQGIRYICENNCVDEDIMKMLIYLPEAYGKSSVIIDNIKNMTNDAEIIDAVEQLEAYAVMLEKTSDALVNIDLSILNDLNYYNGIVFHGYVEGIPSRVLSGGQYDHLMNKMGKKSKAIGFAVYLDLLDRIKAVKTYDVDVLLIYKPTDDIQKVFKRVSSLIYTGKTVAAQTTVPSKLLYQELEEFEEMD